MARLGVRSSGLLTRRNPAVTSNNQTNAHAVAARVSDHIEKGGVRQPRPPDSVKCYNSERGIIVAP